MWSLNTKLKGRMLSPEDLVTHKPKTRKKQSIWGYLFVIFMALCLLLPLSFLVVPETRSVGKSIASLWWERGEAQIISVEIKSKYSESSVLYRTTGEYRYEWAGQTYTSSQLFFGPGYDNVGRYHQRIYQELNRSKARNSPVTVWINPRHPDRAVLYRGIRLEMLGIKLGLLIVFGPIGLLLLLSPFLMARKEKQTDALIAQYPNEPWLWEGKWQSAQLRSSNKGEFIGRAFFTFVILFLTVPMLFQVPRYFSKINGSEGVATFIAVLLSAIFLVGMSVGFIIQTYRVWRSWRLERRVTVFLETLPIILGQPLTAQAHIPASYDLKTLQAGLERWSIITTKDGDGTSSNEKLEFETAERISAAKLVPGVRVFQINIPTPEGQPETTWDDRDLEGVYPRVNTHWKLRLKGETKWGGFNINYDIPVARPKAPVVE